MPLFLLLLGATADDLAAARSAGAAALAAKDGPAAEAAYTRCLELAPADLECRWERGWARWLQNAWAGVVEDWEAVAAVDPGWQSIETQLPQARAQLDLVRRLAKSRAAAPATYRSEAPAGATLHLRAVGDLMIGTDFPAGHLPPDGGAGAFAQVADLLRGAELTFGNLEGPLCDNPEPSEKCRPDAAPGSCYAFRTPTAYGRWYQEAGFDVLSTANNHAGDFGDACRAETEATLDRLGLRWSGRPGTVAEWTVDGMKVGLVAFHTNAACNYLNDLPTASALVQDLATRNDLVLVSFHGGAEGSKALHVPAGPETFYGENRGDLRAFSRAVIDAGADLVIGHGPHVLRAMEVYRGRLVAYSLGNFATYGRFNLGGNQGIGAVLDVTLATDGALVAARILGTRQVGAGIPVPDPDNAAADLVRVLSAEDFPETGVQIAQDGTIAVR